MADPQNPQAISSTPDPGHVTLPDGRVVPTLDTYFNQQANNPTGFQTQNQRTAISQGYSNYVAGPATDALGNFISSFPPAKLAEKAGLLAPETTAMASRGIASAVIPQNLTQLGIDAGIAATGGAMAPLKLGKGMNAAGRLVGATAGGMAGGALDTGDLSGALTGAGQGIVSSVPAETVSGLYDYSRKVGIERARAKINEIYGNQMAEAVATAPNLKGVFGAPKTVAELEDLAKGATVEVMPDGTKRVWAKGSKMLSDYVEKQDLQVKQILDQLQQQRGVTLQFPDALDPGKFTDWDTARRNLSELRVKAYGGVKGQPLEPTIKGVDSKQLYNETRRILQSQLSLADNTGQALQFFNDGQQVFSSGRAWLSEVIRPAFSRKGAEGPVFNSEVVQGRLADKRVSNMKRMGVDDFNKAANAVGLQGQGQSLLPGQGPMGSADVFSPGGAMARMSDIINVPGGGIIRTNLGTPSLVGGQRNPLMLSDAARTGVTLGGTQALAPVAQFLADQMRASQGQGLPLK